MRVLFGILLILLISSVSIADSCIDWFVASKIDSSSSDCEMNCSILATDLGTFECPGRCSDFCKKQAKCDNDLFWKKQFDDRRPKNWRSDLEQTKVWSEDEKSKVLETLNKMPDLFKISALKGIFRMKTSNGLMTAHSQVHQKISFENIEKLELAVSSERIIDQIGTPDEKNKSQEGNQTLEIWNYFNPGEPKTLGASFTVDSKTKKLLDKMYIPRPQEPQYKIEYLQKKEFSKLNFEKIQAAPCEKIHYETDPFLIDQNSGVIVRINRKTNEVASIGWIRPSETEKLKKEILAKCAK